MEEEEEEKEKVAELSWVKAATDGPLDKSAHARRKEGEEDKSAIGGGGVGDSLLARSDTSGRSSSQVLSPPSFRSKLKTSGERMS